MDYEYSEKQNIGEYIKLDKKEEGEMEEIIDNLLELDPSLRRNSTELLNLPIFQNVSVVPSNLAKIIKTIEDFEKRERLNKLKKIIKNI